MGLIFDTHAHYDDIAFDDDREKILSSLPKNDNIYDFDIHKTLKSFHSSIDTEF